MCQHRLVRLVRYLGAWNGNSGRSPARMFLLMCSPCRWLSSNGIFPVSSSKQTIPKLYTSAFSVHLAASCSSTSGAYQMQGLEAATAALMAFAAFADALGLGLGLAAATVAADCPNPATLTWRCASPCRVLTSTLDGFRSPW